METLKELLSISEARDPSLSYVEKPINKKVGAAIDKVTVALNGNQSAKFTKISREFSRLKTAAEKLADRQGKLNAYIKDEALALFDAEDEIYTRVVETVSMVIQLSKTPVPAGPKTEIITDYDKIIAGVLELVPELREQIEELIKTNTEIKTTEPKPGVAKSPALSVKVNEGIDFKTMKNIVKVAFSKVRTWARSFDKKLSKLQQMADKL
jgi:hypothetical protein